MALDGAMDSPCGLVFASCHRHVEQELNLTGRVAKVLKRPIFKNKVNHHMKFISLLMAAALGVFGTANIRAQTNAIRFHALVLTERGDQHEAFVAAALPWLRQIAAQDQFSVDLLANP